MRGKFFVPMLIREQKVKISSIRNKVRKQVYKVQCQLHKRFEFLLIVWGEGGRKLCLRRPKYMKSVLVFTRIINLN